MRWTPRLNRCVAATLLASTLVTGAASVAAAKDHRDRDEWRGDRGRVVYRDYRPGSTYIVRRSSAGPAIAGFLGGLFLGAVLADQAPRGYVYYDPYCHEEFTSLEAYRVHRHPFRHGALVRVIAINSGECVGTYRYGDDGWCPYGYDRNDRGWRDHGRDGDDGDWNDNEH
ncbi:MAG: hypothetical protein HYR74_04025 [Candidatus Eisenbacteria bacterium]|nr:hypothetical protein [Candidatus Eisenbacteria bacterium]